jgi:hypothetical protein
MDRGGEGPCGGFGGGSLVCMFSNFARKEETGFCARESVESGVCAALYSPATSRQARSGLERPW